VLQPQGGAGIKGEEEGRQVRGEGAAAAAVVAAAGGVEVFHQASGDGLVEDGGGEATGRRRALVGGEGVDLGEGEEDGVGQTLDALVGDGSGAELIGPAAGTGAQGGGGGWKRRRRCWVGAFALGGCMGGGGVGGGGGGGGGRNAPGLDRAAVRVTKAPHTAAACPALLLLLALAGV